MNHADKLRMVFENLNKSNKVQGLNRESFNETETLANSFVEIDEICGKLKGELFPKLLNDLNEAEVNDLLIEIGEEFRHLLYHIYDSSFYNYLDERG